MPIELVDDRSADDIATELAEVLVDCVEGGASLGFAPLDPGFATDWWAGALRAGPMTWVARDDSGRAVGVVQLSPAAFPNGAHRAEVKKLLVRHDARGHGVAGRLMAALEQWATDNGRWLLMLDTETGSPAESLYERWGWLRFGLLVDHAARPDGTLAPTTFMTKRLHH